jgi:periplasmic protein TonB
LAFKYIFSPRIGFQVHLFAQDTIYYDHNKNKIEDKAMARYIDVVSYDELDSEKVTVLGYFAGFIPKSENHYSLYSKKKQNGRCTEWYQNGNIKSIIDYTDSLTNGERVTYWKNGKLKRKEILKMGNLQEGKYYDSLGGEISYYPYLKMPTFPGGQTGLSKFLTRNLRYPYAALKKADEGIVYLSFIVDANGQIEDVRVMKGVSKELDEEAVRVVRLMPNWEPAMEDGELVKVKFALPLRFTTGLSEKQKAKRKRAFQAAS